MLWKVSVLTSQGQKFTGLSEPYTLTTTTNTTTIIVMTNNLRQRGVRENGRQLSGSYTAANPCLPFLEVGRVCDKGINHVS